MDKTINLDNLRITQRDIDELTGLDVSDITIGWALRLSLFQQPKRVLSWLTTQILTLGVALILCVPVTLLLGRSLGGSAHNASVIKYVPVGVGVAIASTLTWNAVLFYRGKQRLTLAHLLDEIDHFNEILTAVEIFNELQSAGASTATLDNQHTVIEALHLTRESLVNGLMTERVMRKHQRFIAHRADLFTHIEQNLTSLQAMKIADEASEYSTLLQEALQVGTSVHQELQRLQTEKQTLPPKQRHD